MRLFGNKRVSLDSSMDLSQLSFSEREIDTSMKVVQYCQHTERAKSKESIKSNEMMSEFIIESVHEFSGIIPEKKKDKRSLFANLNQNKPKLIKGKTETEKRSKRQENKVKLESPKKEAIGKPFETKIQLLKNKLNRIKSYVSPEKKPVKNGQRNTSKGLNLSNQLISQGNTN